MYLKQLLKSGFDGIAEWRDMWNNEILPYLRSLRPLAGHGICTEEKADGTVINATAAPTAAAETETVVERALYNSHFKLTLDSFSSGGSVTYTVTVADGATGNYSRATVNCYNSYILPPYTETVAEDRLFYLKYTPAVYGSGGAVVSSATMNSGSLVSSGGSALRLPQGDGACYIQLGRVLWSSGTPQVVQDFTAGVADVRWYVSCW